MTSCMTSCNVSFKEVCMSMIGLFPITHNDVSCNYCQEDGNWPVWLAELN